MRADSPSEDSARDNADERREERVRWTQDQDTFLRSIVDTYGTRDWNIIADNMNSKFQGAGKSARQCRQRWQKHVHPALSKHQWSEREEVDLLLAHQKFKNSWSEISCALKGRNNNSIKNRFYTIFRKVRNKIRKGDFTYTSKGELLQIHYIIVVIESYFASLPESESVASKSGKDFIYKLIQNIDTAGLAAYKKHLNEIVGEKNSMERLFVELSQAPEEEKKSEEPAPIEMLEEAGEDEEDSKEPPERSESKSESPSEDRAEGMQCSPQPVVPMAVPVATPVPTPTSAQLQTPQCVSGNASARMSDHDPFPSGYMKKDTSPLDSLMLSPSLVPKYSPCLLSAGPAAAAAAAANAPCFQAPADQGFSEFTESAEEPRPIQGATYTVHPPSIQVLYPGQLGTGQGEMMH